MRAFDYANILAFRTSVAELSMIVDIIDQVSNDLEDTGNKLVNELNVLNKAISTSLSNLNYVLSNIETMSSDIRQTLSAAKTQIAADVNKQSDITSLLERLHTGLTDTENRVRLLLEQSNIDRTKLSDTISVLEKLVRQSDITQKDNSSVALINGVATAINILSRG